MNGSDDEEDIVFEDDSNESGSEDDDSGSESNDEDGLESDSDGSIEEETSINEITENVVVSSDENGDKESCPVCLNRFRGQDLGTPENCDHVFCLECISEWSKNINTCPIDRIEFNRIYLKSSPTGKILKKIQVKIKPKEPENALLEEDTTLCEVCHLGDREHRLLLCDACDLAYHCDCLDPPLFHIPIEEWFCPPCGGILDTRDRAGLSGYRPRRVIPRTIASEAVRTTVQNRRTRTTSTSHSFPSTSTSTRRKTPKRRRRTYRKVYKKTVHLARTKQNVSGASKGKGNSQSTVVLVKYGKKRKRRRRKRRNLKSKRNTSQINIVKGVKDRIAGRLGLCKPHKGNSIPDVKVKTGSSSGSSFRGLASCTLFGDKDQLMDFNENFHEESTSSSASCSNSNHQNYSEASTSSINLLDSIMAGQTLLHSKSDNVIIRTDGSLIMKSEIKKDHDKQSVEDKKSVIRIGLSKLGAIPKQSQRESAFKPPTTSASVSKERNLTTTADVKGNSFHERLQGKKLRNLLKLDNNKKSNLLPSTSQFSLSQPSISWNDNLKKKSWDSKDNSFGNKRKFCPTHRPTNVILNEQIAFPFSNSNMYPNENASSLVGRQLKEDSKKLSVRSCERKVFDNAVNTENRNKNSGNIHDISFKTKHEKGCKYKINKPFSFMHPFDQSTNNSVKNERILAAEYANNSRPVSPCDVDSQSLIETLSTNVNQNTKTLNIKVEKYADEELVASFLPSANNENSPFNKDATCSDNENCEYDESQSLLDERSFSESFSIKKSVENSSVKGKNRNKLKVEEKMEDLSNEFTHPFHVKNVNVDNLAKFQKIKCELLSSDEDSVQILEVNVNRNKLVAFQNIKHEILSSDEDALDLEASQSIIESTNEETKKTVLFSAKKAPEQRIEISCDKLPYIKKEPISPGKTDLSNERGLPSIPLLSEHLVEGQSLITNTNVNRLDFIKEEHRSSDESDNFHETEWHISENRLNRGLFSSAKEQIVSYQSLQLIDLPPTQLANQSCNNVMDSLPPTQLAGIFSSAMDPLPPTQISKEPSNSNCSTRAIISLSSQSTKDLSSSQPVELDDLPCTPLANLPSSHFDQSSVSNKLIGSAIEDINDLPSTQLPNSNQVPKLSNTNSNILPSNDDDDDLPATQLLCQFQSTKDSSSSQLVGLDNLPCTHLADQSSSHFEQPSVSNKLVGLATEDIVDLPSTQLANPKQFSKLPNSHSNMLSSNDSDDLPATQSPCQLNKILFSSKKEQIAPYQSLPMVDLPSTQLENQSCNNILDSLPSTQLVGIFSNDMDCLPPTQISKEPSNCSTTIAVSLSSQSTKDSSSSQLVELDNLPCTQLANQPSSHFEQPSVSNKLVGSAKDDIADLPSTQLANPKQFSKLPNSHSNILPSNDSDSLPATQLNLPSNECYHSLASNKSAVPSKDLENLCFTQPANQPLNHISESLPPTQLVQSHLDELPPTQLVQSYLDELPPTQLVQRHLDDLPLTQLVQSHLDDLTSTHLRLNHHDHLLNSSQLSESICTSDMNDLPPTQMAKVPANFPLLSNLQGISSVHNVNDSPCSHHTEILHLPPTTESCFSSELVPTQPRNSLVFSNNDLLSTEHTKTLIDKNISQDNNENPTENYSTTLNKISESVSSLISNTLGIESTSSGMDNVNLPATQLTSSHSEMHTSSMDDSDLPPTQPLKSNGQSAIQFKHLDESYDKFLGKTPEFYDSLLKTNNTQKDNSPLRKIGVHKNLPQVIPSIPGRGILVPKPSNRKTFSFDQVKEKLRLNDEDCSGSSELSCKLNNTTKNKVNFSSQDTYKLEVKKHKDMIKNDTVFVNQITIAKSELDPSECVDYLSPTQSASSALHSLSKPFQKVNIESNEIHLNSSHKIKTEIIHSSFESILTTPAKKNASETSNVDGIETHLKACNLLMDNRRLKSEIVDIPMKIKEEPLSSEDELECADKSINFMPNKQTSKKDPNIVVQKYVTNKSSLPNYVEIKHIKKEKIENSVGYEHKHETLNMDKNEKSEKSKSELAKKYKESKSTEHENQDVKNRNSKSKLRMVGKNHDEKRSIDKQSNKKDYMSKHTNGKKNCVEKDVTNGPSHSKHHKEHKRKDGGRDKETYKLDSIDQKGCNTTQGIQKRKANIDNYIESKNIKIRHNDYDGKAEIDKRRDVLKKEETIPSIDDRKKQNMVESKKIASEKHNKEKRSMNQHKTAEIKDTLKSLSDAGQKSYSCNARDDKIKGKRNIENSVRNGQHCELTSFSEIGDIVENQKQKKLKTENLFYSSSEERIKKTDANRKRCAETVINDVEMKKRLHLDEGNHAIESKIDDGKKSIFRSPLLDNAQSQNISKKEKFKKHHQRNAFDVLNDVADEIIISSSRMKYEFESASGSLELELLRNTSNSPLDAKNKKVINKRDLKEEIANEVKLVLKPFYSVGVINKDDYKDIMRRAVPKIFTNCRNCINPEKIKKLVLNYVSMLRNNS